MVVWLKADASCLECHSSKHCQDKIIIIEHNDKYTYYI